MKKHLLFLVTLLGSVSASAFCYLTNEGQKFKELNNVACGERQICISYNKAGQVEAEVLTLTGCNFFSCDWESPTFIYRVSHTGFSGSKFLLEKTTTRSLMICN